MGWLTTQATPQHTYYHLGPAFKSQSNKSIGTQWSMCILNPGHYWTRLGLTCPTHPCLFACTKSRNVFGKLPLERPWGLSQYFPVSSMFKNGHNGHPSLLCFLGLVCEWKQVVSGYLKADLPRNTRDTVQTYHRDKTY